MKNKILYSLVSVIVILLLFIYSKQNEFELLRAQNTNLLDEKTALLRQRNQVIESNAQLDLKINNGYHNIKQKFGRVYYSVHEPKTNLNPGKAK